MTVETIITMAAILSAWAGFTEWRIRTMYTQMKEKIEDKEKLNQVIQAELRNDIQRLETKIDMLINLQIKVPSNGN